MRKIKMLFVIYLTQLVDTLPKHGKTSSNTITNYGDDTVKYIFITEGEFLNSYFIIFAPPLKL